MLVEHVPNNYTRGCGANGFSTFWNNSMPQFIHLFVYLVVKIVKTVSDHVRH